MNCPLCRADGSVIRTDGNRRRRECVNCRYRWNTVELAEAEVKRLRRVAEALRLGLPTVNGETTRTEYRRQAPKRRERWGERQYAKTEAQAMTGEYLKPLDFTIYLDAFRNGERGSTQANHDVRLVSTMFSWAIARGYTLFNPVSGALYVSEKVRKVRLDDATREKDVTRSSPLRERYPAQAFRLRNSRRVFGP